MLENIKSSVLKSKNISPFLVPSEHHNMQAVPPAGSIFWASWDPTGQRYKTVEISSWGSFQAAKIRQGHYSGDTIHNVCLPLQA